MISICPYPENRNQEILVNHVVRTADIISKIKNLITLPLKKTPLYSALIQKIIH